MKKRIINRLFLWGLNGREISRITGYKYPSVHYYLNVDYRKRGHGGIINGLSDYLPNLRTGYTFLRPDTDRKQDNSHSNGVQKRAI